MFSSQLKFFIVFQLLTDFENIANQCFFKYTICINEKHSKVRALVALLTLPADVATTKAALLIDKKLLQLSMNTGVNAKYKKHLNFLRGGLEIKFDASYLYLLF